jgi:sec-independent protein translocase protein TatA
MSPVLPLALIGDVGGIELLVIMGAILLLFGGKGLPGIAKSFGKMTETLRRASQDFKDQMMDADRDPPAGSSLGESKVDPPKEVVPRDPAG